MNPHIRYVYEDFPYLSIEQLLYGKSMTTKKKKKTMENTTKKKMNYVLFIYEEIVR